jgi:predicted RNase H-like HicB family nuclease
LKVRDVIREVEADGWRLLRTRGSHRQFKHSLNPGLVTVASGTKEHSKTGGTQTLNTVRYAVIIEQGDESYGASVPDLPGCIAVAETLEEVESMIREAIDFHIEGLREEGMQVPIPTTRAEYVETVA